MDELLKKDGHLDLKLTPYKVLATSTQDGKLYFQRKLSNLRHDGMRSKLSSCAKHSKKL